MQTIVLIRHADITNGEWEVCPHNDILFFLSDPDGGWDIMIKRCVL